MITHFPSSWRIGIVVAALVTTIPAPAISQNVRPLSGHKEAVDAVAYSADGKILATGGHDKLIKLWDTATFKEIKTLEGHTDLVLSLTFSKDGTKLLSGGHDKLVKIWSLPADKDLRNIAPLAAALKSVATSTDGKLLATAADDGIVRLYEAPTSKPIRELKGHTGPIYAVAFAPNNVQLYSAGADRSIRLWDVNAGTVLAQWESGVQPAVVLGAMANGQAVVTGDSAGLVKRWRLPVKPTRTIPGHAAEITLCRMHPNTVHSISVGVDNTVRHHDLTNGSLLKTVMTTGPITDFVVPAGNQGLLATVGPDKAIRVWNLGGDGKQLAAREGLADAATAIALTPDTKTMLVGEGDGTIRYYAYPFEAQVAIKPIAAHAGPVTALSRSQDGTVILTAGNDKGVRLWTDAGAKVRDLAHPVGVRHAALSPDKKLVAAVGDNNELRVWTVEGQEKKVLPNLAGPLAFSPDGQWLAVAGLDSKLYVHPTAFNAPPKAVTVHAAAIRAVAFAPQGNQVFTASNDKLIKIADAAAGKEIKSLAGHQAAVGAVAISGDGKWAISGGDDKNVMLWDLVGGKPPVTVIGANGGIVAVAISADGGKYAAAAADGFVRLYHAGMLRETIPQPGPTGLAFAKDDVSLITSSADKNLRFISPAAPRIVGKHTGKVRAIITTADGKQAISAGDDGKVVVWDIATGNQLRAVAHAGPALAAALSPDQKLLATGSADKTCKLWNFADGKPLASFEATNAVASVSISRDNLRVAFASLDNMARVHKITGEELQTFTVAGLRGVELMGDNRTVALGSTDKLIRAAELGVDWVQKHTTAITSLALAPNGAWAAVASDSVVIRNANDGNQIRAIPIAGPSAVSAAADSVRLLAGGSDKILRLFDVNSGALLQEYPAGAAAITATAFAVDGKTLAAADAAGNLSLYSPPPQPNMKGELLQTFVRPVPVNAIAFLSDNKTLATSVGDKSVRFLEIPPPPSITLTGHNSHVHCVAISADGKQAASGAGDNAIIVWDLVGNKQLKPLAGHKMPVYSLAFSADGKTLASCSADKTIQLWDIAGGKSFKTMEGSLDFLYRLSYVAGGAQIVAGGVDKIIRFYDLGSGKPARQFPPHSDEIYGLAVNAAGTRLATSGYAGNVVVWDSSTGKPLFQQKFGVGAYDIAFHPNGSQIAIAHNDSKVYVIDLPAGAR